jgi:undecaprenyl-diphosphatase
VTRSSLREFVGARFRPGTPLGLALTLLLALLVLLVTATSTVVDDVVENDKLVGLDAPVEGTLFGWRTDGLTAVMRAITQLGSAYVVIPVLLAAGLLARRARGSWRPMAFLGATVGGASATSTVIKLLVARPRPTSGALVHALGYAFPSGHSTTGAATWFSLAVLGGSFLRSMAGRVLLGVLAVGVVVGIGISRIYLGVHAPTDVLGGWALGAAWVAGVLVLGRLRPAPPRP